MAVPPTDADYVSRSRVVLASSYFIMPLEAMVKNRLPGFGETVVRVLATPRVSPAQFGQYLLDMEPGAFTSRPVKGDFEHFFYQLSGEVTLTTDGKEHIMPEGGFAYLPASTSFTLKNGGAGAGRVLWTKKRYEEADGFPPPRPIFGHRNDAEPLPTTLAGLVVQPLIPLADPSYDMAMNLMLFETGVYFDRVEMHHQEHGLYMLRGQGLYYLTGNFHEVKKDDYIYMAPYCPQYFFATGYSMSEYLLYKDVNRDGFAGF